MQNPEIVNPDWREWARKFFPSKVTAPFAQRQVELWEWFEKLEPGVTVRPRAAPWPRNSGKTSSAELAVTRMACRLNRKFVLYVAVTQEKANERLKNIASNLEKLGIPRGINEYGQSIGWKANLLRTDDGFSILGIGIDTAARGTLLDGDRPSVIIFDDVDDSEDTPAAVEKKIRIITRSLLPSGSTDCAVLFVENMMHENSIMCQIVNQKASFLLDIDVCEAIPAVLDLKVEQYVDPKTGRTPYRIIGGTATWEGQDLKACEKFINTFGLNSFLIECQHEVEIASEGGLWSMEEIDRNRIAKSEALADYGRICVGVDPNVSTGNDEAGIVVCGIVAGYRGDKQLHGFVLEDATVAGGPKKWTEAAVSAYNRWSADLIVAEKNNGGDLVAIAIATIPGAPAVKLVTASRGKIARAEPIQKLYMDGRIHHVGRFDMLEKEMITYKHLSGQASPGKLDALVWACSELMLGVKNTKEALTLAAKAVEHKGSKPISSKFGGVW